MSKIIRSSTDEAIRKYKIIEGFLDHTQTLTSIHIHSTIPKRTLTYWVKQYRLHGLKGLAHHSRKDKGSSRKHSTHLQQVIEGLYFQKPTPTRATIHRLTIQYCTQKALPIPHYRFVCRVIQKLPKDMKTLATKGAKVYQQTYDLLHMRSAAQPNEIWQADHVLLDMPVLHSGNTLKQPWLTIIMDDCSRAICGYELSFLNPSAQKTALCLRQALWRKPDPRWIIMGVPDIFYTDHGSDFTSQHIEQVCIELKIRLIHSTVGKPRGRGKIERFFRTLNQVLLEKLQCLVQGSAEKKPITLKCLDKLIYEFIIDYNHKVHKAHGMSPSDRWKHKGFLPRILNSLEELDLLLFTTAKPRQVLRDGIHFQGLRYSDSILANYVGEQVVIRYNPTDISSLRIYYKGIFLCQPNCQELLQETISLKDLQQARSQRKRQLKKAIVQRKSLIEAVIDANKMTIPALNEEPVSAPLLPKQRIKLYETE